MARVQAASNNSTGTGTVAVAISSAGAGNLLVAVGSVNEVSGGDVDINTPSGFTPVSIADTNNTTKVRGRMFYKVAAGGETSVTFTAASGTPDIVGYVIEWGGITSATEDLAVESTGSTSPAVTATLGTPAAGAIAFALIAINNDNNLSTPTNSYTLEGTVASTNATAGNRTRLGLLYNASPGATNTQLTQGGTARSYVTQLVTFVGSASTTPISDTDSGTGTEGTPTLTTATADTDSGTGTDAESALATSLSDTDSGTGTETNVVGIPISDSDSGTGTEGAENIVPVIPPAAPIPFTMEGWQPTGDVEVEYTVKIADLHGAILEEVPAKNIQYSFFLNESGNANFSLPIDHPKCNYDLLTPGKRQILIYRNSTLVWGGYLWAAQIQEPLVMFSAADWFSRLQHRYLSDPFSRHQDQLKTAWDLIAYTQAKSTLDIVQFNPGQTSGVKRKISYSSMDRSIIAELIQNLAASDNGFDFEITPDKYWKVYYPTKGQALQEVILELGKNIRTYTGDWDANSLATEITGIGSSVDNSEAILATYSSAAAEAEFGLLEESLSYTDITDKDLLRAAVREELRVSKQVLIRPGVFVDANDPPYGSYGIGDTVRVIMQRGYYMNIDSAFRISTILVQVADSGQELIQLEFQDGLS